MNLFAVPLRGVEDSIRVAIDDLRTANVLIAKSYTKDTIIQLKDSLIKKQNIKIRSLIPLPLFLPLILFTLCPKVSFS